MSRRWWVLSALGLLSSGTSGCGSRTAPLASEHAVVSDGGMSREGDAGPDAIDDGGPAPVSCVASPPTCRGVPRLVDTTVVSLMSMVGAGNVAVGAFVETGAGPLLGWGARGCCGAEILASGGLVHVAPPLTSEKLWGPGPVRLADIEWAPALTIVDGLVAAIDSHSDPSIVSLVDPTTLAIVDTHTGLPITTAPYQSPALASTSQGVVVLQSGDTVEIEQLDHTFARRNTFSLDEAPGFFLALTPGCGDRTLASWRSGGLAGYLRLRVIGADGRPLSEAREHDLLRDHASAFDGAHTITFGLREIGEIDRMGELRSRTPTERTPHAAAGIEKGVVALIGESGTGTNEIVLFERTTGTRLATLAAPSLEGMSGCGSTGYATSGAAFVAEGFLYVAATFLCARDHVVVFTFACG